jgi:hypothetical protein
MKEFLRDAARWLDDPMTQRAIAVLGALAIYSSIERAAYNADRAGIRADFAHKRIDDLETKALRIIRTRS